MAPKASKVLKTIMKKPAAMAEESKKHNADKGTSSLLAIEAERPMGKNAAQAIQGTLKKLKKADPIIQDSKLIEAWHRMRKSEFSESS